MSSVTAPARPSASSDTVDGLEAVALRAGPLEAVFVPPAGMVGVSLRDRGEELLGRGERLGDYVARGAVVGIPLLHPWANRLGAEGYAAGLRVRLPRGLPRDEHGLPIHGVLPRAFAVQEAGADDGGATLRAALDFAHPAFPFPHRVEQRVRLEPATLTIETVVTATGSVPVPIAFGFHPYLRLPGVPREDWELTLPPRRHLFADARGLPTGEAAWEHADSAPLGRRAFDDGFDALGAEPEFRLAGGGRTITLRFLAGYPVAQVFAPCDQDVVCFEPMTAPVNALVTGRGLRFIAPEEDLRAVFEVRVG